MRSSAIAPSTSAPGIVTDSPGRIRKVMYSEQIWRCIDLGQLRGKLPGTIAQRYMTQFGATSEDFGRIAVLDRKHAANNPNAWFYNRPITLNEHQQSRMNADPLRANGGLPRRKAMVVLPSW